MNTAPWGTRSPGRRVSVRSGANHRHLKTPEHSTYPMRAYAWSRLNRRSHSDNPWTNPTDNWHARRHGATDHNRWNSHSGGRHPMDTRRNRTRRRRTETLLLTSNSRDGPPKKSADRPRFMSPKRADREAEFRPGAAPDPTAPMPGRCRKDGLTKALRWPGGQTLLSVARGPAGSRGVPVRPFQLPPRPRCGVPGDLLGLKDRPGHHLGNAGSELLVAAHPVRTRASDSMRCSR